MTHSVSAQRTKPNSSLTIRIIAILLGLPIFIFLYILNNSAPETKHHYNVHGQSIVLPCSPEAMILIENLLVIIILAVILVEIFLYALFCMDVGVKSTTTKNNASSSKPAPDSKKNAETGSSEEKNTERLSSQRLSLRQFFWKNLSCFTFILSPYVIWTSVAYDVVQKACNSLLQFAVIPSSLATVSDPFGSDNVDSFADESAIAPSFSHQYLGWIFVRLLSLPTWAILIEILGLSLFFILAFTLLLTYVCYEDLLLFPLKAFSLYRKKRKIKAKEVAESLTNKVLLVEQNQTSSKKTR